MLISKDIANDLNKQKYDFADEDVNADASWKFCMEHLLPPWRRAGRELNVH